MDERCASCGADLVAGPADAVEGSGGGFRVTLTGPQTLRCPRGCPGRRTSLEMSGTGIMSLARQLGGLVASRAGFLGKGAKCPGCGEPLVDDGAEGRWTLRGETGRGGPVDLAIEGPSLVCPRCGGRFLPRDARSNGLSKLLMETIGRG